MNAKNYTNNQYLLALAFHVRKLHDDYEKKKKFENL